VTASAGRWTIDRRAQVEAGVEHHPTVAAGSTLHEGFAAPHAMGAEHATRPPLCHGRLRWLPSFPRVSRRPTGGPGALLKGPARLRPALPRCSLAMSAPRTRTRGGFESRWTPVRGLLMHHRVSLAAPAESLPVVLVHCMAVSHLADWVVAPGLQPARCWATPSAARSTATWQSPSGPGPLPDPGRSHHRPSGAQRADEGPTGRMARLALLLSGTGCSRRYCAVGVVAWWGSPRWVGCWVGCWHQLLEVGEPALVWALPSTALTAKSTTRCCMRGRWPDPAVLGVGGAHQQEVLGPLARR
jgi:hypothetical protein